MPVTQGDSEVPVFNPNTPPALAVNAKALNTPFKDKIVRVDTNPNPSICYLQEIHFKHKATER